MLLRENQIYTIDEECPRGVYMISSNSANVDAVFSQYPEIDELGDYWYRRCHICYFGFVEIEEQFTAVKIENGKAFLMDEETFNLYDMISDYTLKNGEYNQLGASVYNNPICDIKVYLQYKESCLFYGEILAEINEQYIFSVNSRYYWAICLDVKSFKKYNRIEICLESDYDEKKYMFGQNGFSFGSITNVEFDASGEDLLFYRFDNKELLIMQLPEGVDPSTLRIAWIYPDIATKKLLPTRLKLEDLYSSDYGMLSSILDKYKSMGLDIDISEEIRQMKDAPDFASIGTSFLVQEYYEFERFQDKRPSKELKYTFHVGLTLNKKYYCAVKLAERAEDIRPNEENTVYYITYNGTQTEEIALMYYNLATIFNSDKDYMIDIYEYLKEYDYFTYLEESIVRKLEEIRAQYRHSIYIGDDVLSHIKYSIRQYRKRKLTELYIEMIKENRVATKWSSEYRLFSIVKSYVYDAIYQYKSEWLGAQSFDIYLPSQRIAVEYQGKQHYEVVDIFGGEEGYQSNVKRDERKRQLAAAQGVVVLDWKYTTPVRDETVTQFLINNNIKISTRKESQDSLTTNEMLLNMAPPMISGKKSISRIEAHTVPSKNVIRRYDKEGHFIDEYNTIKEAAANTSVSEKSIRNVISGIRKTGGGFLWEQCARGSSIEDIAAVTVEKNSGLPKAVIQMDLEGNIIKVFCSKSEASKQTGVNTRSILDAINGNQKTAGGFRWTYQNWPDSKDDE